MIRIQTEDFSSEGEVKTLLQGRSEVGGVVSFVGTVRDYSDAESVAALELEHYPGMTEAELIKIESAARARFAVEEILVVHRVGRLSVADNIVLVVAAARHRADAFDACRFVIDHLKVFATFWKKEISVQGRERWVNSCPGCEAAGSQWEASGIVEATGIDGHQTGCRSGHANGASPVGHTHDVAWTGLRAGLLTLSDSRGQTSDPSGDALEGLLLGYGAVVAAREWLPDERGAIRELLRRWAGVLGLDVIVTTGGTGPGPRDVTPEATRDVCDRELPGFSELIRAEGLRHVRSAALTRGVSAFCGSTLVINLPGSTQGAVQSLVAVADLVPHALRMARGGGH
ncbi:MAG: molybdenum cofactor biosynthesis protein MoaE [Magnetococcus sp. YQC-5]